MTMFYKVLSAGMIAAMLCVVPCFGELVIEEWVQGEPVEVEPESDMVTILDFYSSGCGVCEESVNKLNDLDARDDIQVVAVTDDAPDVILQFAENTGAAYALARDDEEQTWQFYTEDLDDVSFPHSFIFSRGVVIWHGSPQDLLGIMNHLGEGPVDEVALQGADVILLRKKVAEARLEAWVEEYLALVRYGLPEHHGEIKTLGVRIRKCAVEWGFTGILGTLGYLIATETDVEYRDLQYANEIASLAVRQSSYRNPDLRDSLACVLYARGYIPQALAEMRAAITVCRQQGCDMLDSLLCRLEAMETGEFLNEDGE